MSVHHPETRRLPSLLAGIGGLMAALGIGLSAYAAHGIADAGAQANVRTAALYILLHGIGFAALAPSSRRRLGCCGLYIVLIGVVLFSGSLIGKALLQWPSRLAPMGGVGMMLGWVLWAFDALRR